LSFRARKHPSAKTRQVQAAALAVSGCFDDKVIVENNGAFSRQKRPF